MSVEWVRALLAGAGCVLILAMFANPMASVPAAADASAELSAVEARVRADHGDVAALSSARLQAMLTATRAEGEAPARAPLILDVREADEVAVSRIPGALRVDPGIWTSTFLSRFGEAAAGRDVVLYCSVGVRSARLAARVQAALKERGAGAIYNLEGGIFRWHNEARELVDDAGPTERVHPYDDRWGRLVARQQLVAKTPRRMQGG